MSIEKRIAEINTSLQGKQLVYFGTRGADAEPLLKITNFSKVFSLIAPLYASTVEEICLETLTRERVELDNYSIDFDCRPVVSQIRREMLRALEVPSVLIAYRPCAFLSSVWFPRSDRVDYLGLFHGHQSCFEHKAWVETQLAKVGVPVLAWRFFADEEREIIKEWAEEESIVLRANRSDGGSGVCFVPDAKTLEEQWPPHGDGFISVAPFYKDCLSLNINACVFADGSATLHGPSVQLIGVSQATNRRFGYCGNDFAAARDVDLLVWDELENLTRMTARWLRSQGYLGVFGIDALVVDGRVFLTEINPRFQGSSVLSARLDKQAGRSDVFTEHIAAFFGLSAQKEPRLRDLARSQAACAHLVAHNTTRSATRVGNVPDEGGDFQCRLLPEADIEVSVDGILFDAVYPGTVSSDGRILSPVAAAGVETMLAHALERDTPILEGGGTI